MGKQGPCYHCGVTSTPLWRNGPPEKPVLCNACGSRWRTKGTLVNYTPLHARAEPDDYEDHRVSRMKSMSINKNKEVKLVKRKQHPDRVVVGADYSNGFRKVVDEDTSNRSSSGSAISNSESCAHFGSADASPAQSMVWDSSVPSRKRTCVGRPKQSSVEKLTKDLYTILHEQQSSYFSGSSEEDLLFESEAPMVSVEIGHGSVLMRHPSYIAREEESEASSLSVDNKHCQINEAYSHSASLLVHNNKGTNMSSTVIGKMNNPARQGMQQELLKRDKSQHDNFQILGSHNSPLRHIDLHDIVNYEEFMKQLSNEEQQQLVMHLPAVDVKFPYSLRSMFDSPQFAENLNSFQQLLAEGVFDIPPPEAKTEDCKTLKRLALTNSLKSKWVGCYHLIKKKCKASTGKAAVSGSNFTTSSSFRHIKRLRDSETQSFQDVKIVMKSPKRVIMKGGYESKDIIDYEGSCFSPRSLFALPSDSSSLMMDSISFIEESSDQDLLLDVPSNGFYPQAELLHPALTFGSQQASTSSSSVYRHPLHP